MKTELFRNFCRTSIDAITFAEAEAIWRQRTSVDACHLLLGVITVDMDFASIFESGELTWGKASQDIDDFVRPFIKVTMQGGEKIPDHSPLWKKVIQRSSTLATSYGHTRVSSDHLLLAISEQELLAKLYCGKWGLSPDSLANYAHSGLEMIEAKNKQTKAYEIKIAKRYIEICGYHEFNSKTLMQKKSVPDVIKARHQWEDKLAALSGPLVH